VYYSVRSLNTFRFPTKGLVLESLHPHPEGRGFQRKSKEGLVWTLSLKSEAPVDVILPEEASLVDMSESPLEVEGNKITMPTGEVQISFILQDLEDQKTVQDIGTNTDKDLTKIILPLGALLALLVLGVALWKR